MQLSALPSLFACLFLASCATESAATSGPEADAVEPAEVQSELAEAQPEPEPDTRTADLRTVFYAVEIDAPVELVWERTFSAEGYTQWTAPFMEGSYFEGDWEEGESMHFLAPGGSGMLAVIETHRPLELMSIKHIGFVVGGVENTSGPGVESWAPAYENYHFESIPGGTRFTVEHEILAASEADMAAVWGRALQALKELCEQG